jgi:hypothetical protein
MTIETKKPIEEKEKEKDEQKDVECEDIRTSDRVQWQRREPTASENRDERDHARISITPVMIRIRKQHGAILLVRNLTRNTEQPLLSKRY